MQEENSNLVIGSYSDGKDAPALFYFDAAEKKATSVLTETNPSYVVRSEGYYYVLCEHKTGLLVTLNSKFEVLSRIQTMGDDPCHATIDNTGQFIVITNYSSASIIICRFTDHIPTSVHSFIAHEGSSVNPDRQASPHPHSSVFSDDNDILFVADLGTDIVYYYNFTPEKVTWAKEKSIKMVGVGPRTICKGKKGSKLLYLTGELDNTVRVLSYKEEGLGLTVAYKISQNVDNFPGEVFYLNSQVYVALRGDDKMMLFHEKEDKLELNCSFKVEAFPRFFVVTPGGTMYVACQKGNVVEKYHIAAEKITLLSQLAINTPSCVVVL
jgi:6-phosphogluconolactonase